MNPARRALCALAAVGAAAVVSTLNAPSGTLVAASRSTAQDRTVTVVTPQAIQEATSGIALATSRPQAAPSESDHHLPAAASTAGDLPDTAWFAYQRAAAVIATVKPGCHLDWSLLAALGQIESDHGRSGGATLLADGTSFPAIRGVALDGRGPVASVADTDDGQLDGDPIWDRAVGPMQFLPSTWRSVQVDGDGDGVRSADDIDDATLAAGVYLCAWNDDLATDQGLHHALLRYNRSAAYVASAISLARAYSARTQQSLAASFIGNAAGVETTISSSSRHTTRARHGVGDVASSAAGTPSVAAPTGAVPSPTPAPAASSTPTPSEEPAPTKAATPSTSPAPPQETASPTESPSPTPTAAASPGPDELVTLSGTLTSCGDGFCVAGTQLQLGGLEAVSNEDFDGDGSIESKGAELQGLVGSPATVRVEQGTDPAVVATLNGHAWT